MFDFTALYDKVGFPGLGIKDFSISEIAFSITENIQIRWYALCIVLGMIAAVTYAFIRAKRYGFIFDDIIDIAFFAIIPGIIGARLYYVIFDYFKRPEDYTSLLDIFAIWRGGLAIYGGLIFGIIGAIVGLKVKKIRILPFLDCAFPGVMLAQAMGRWGNFFNMEAYGDETSIFCRMRLSSESGLSFIEVHPTFLYESLWNLVGFIALVLLTKKRKFDGQIFLMSVAWYGLGRSLIEGLRTDSLMIGSVRVSQALAIILLVASLTLLIVMFIMTKKRHVARCIYEQGSKKYIPYECEDGLDPDYDYDISLLYTKKEKNITVKNKTDNKEEISEIPVTESASEEINDDCAADPRKSENADSVTDASSDEEAN